MSVGSDTITVFDNEDVELDFTLTDVNVTDITGWVIKLVIKLLATSPDPPLIGPITASIVGSAPTLLYRFSFNIALAAGTYTYAARRMDTSLHWQTAQGTLVVKQSANE